MELNNQEKIIAIKKNIINYKCILMDYLNALEKMQKYMKLINYIDAFFCLFLLIVILFICLFYFIQKINQSLKEIARMKDVFIIGYF